MKRVISVSLVIIIFLSSCLNGVVIADGNNPSNNPKNNLITGTIGSFYCMTSQNLRDAFDKDYGSLTKSDYLGQKITFFPQSDMEANAASSDVCHAVGVSSIIPNSVPISIKGTAGKPDSVYESVLCFSVDSSKELKSFTFAIPGKDTPWGDCAVDGFTIFSGQSPWKESIDYKKPSAVESDKTFVKIAEVSGLLSSDKWKESENGCFRYYEANFDSPVKTDYLILAFSSDNVSYVRTALDYGKISKCFIALTEFAVFDKDIATAGTEGKYPIEPPVEKLQHVRFLISDNTIERGKEFTITLTFWESEPFSSIELVPDFPDIFTLVSIDDTPYTPKELKRVGRYKWEADSNVIWSAGIAYLTFVSSADAEPGDYEIGFKAKSCKNIDGVDFPVIFETGKITLNDFSYGDINLDGVIDCIDLICLKKYIDGKSANPGEVADVNNDGVTNIEDFNILTEYLADFDIKTGSSEVQLGPLYGA